MFDEPPSRPHPHPLAFGQHDDRTPTHGYPATRETAMAAFGSWNMSASDHSSFIPAALMVGTTSRYPILLATRGMLVFVSMAGKYPFQGLRDGR
jgi:hypothetical protein